MAYRYSPYKIEYLGYYDKIWAHRVNSEEKLNSALKFFKGVEVDLVYDETKNTLDVTHPPVPSIHLDFKQYLSNITKGEYPFIWLDIKNLEVKNSDNILVETRYPEALPSFHEVGFKTSYYLPYGLSEMSLEKYKSEIKKIRLILQEQPYLGVSSNYTDYAVMAKEFPKNEKYFWITSSVRKHGFSEPRKILKDSTVKEVLISYKALRGNR